MDFDDVRQRLRKGNALLFGSDSPCVCGPVSALKASSRRTVVLRALEWAKSPARALRKYFGEDDRFAGAAEMGRMWAEGRVKMPAARRAILGVHAAARETSDPAAVAPCRGVGQACSAVHSPRHAPGLAIYELTALVSMRPRGWEREVENKLGQYSELPDRAAEEVWAARRMGAFFELSPFIVPRLRPAFKILHENKADDFRPPFQVSMF